MAPSCVAQECCKIVNNHYILREVLPVSNVFFAVCFPSELLVTWHRDRKNTLYLFKKTTLKQTSSGGLVFIFIFVFCFYPAHSWSNCACRLSHCWCSKLMTKCVQSHFPYLSMTCVRVSIVCSPCGCGVPCWRAFALGRPLYTVQLSLTVGQVGGFPKWKHWVPPTARKYIPRCSAACQRKPTSC